METLIRLTLSGSALALLLLAIKFVFRRELPSTVYYYAWLIVLVRFILPMPGLIPTGTEGGSQAVYREESPQYEGEAAQFYYAPADSLPQSSEYREPDASSATGSDISETEMPEATETRTGLSGAVRRALRSPELWLVIWGAGTTISFSVYLASYARFTSDMKKSFVSPDVFDRKTYASFSGRRPRLYRSVRSKTPLMYGVLFPKIVLPDRIYDEETLTNIFRHELTHYRRLDTLYKWFSVLVLSTQWFNPLSYYIRREISRACELSCDEMLLRHMSKAEKRSYGNTLLNMAAATALPAGVVATTFSTEKKNLKERLEQIMQHKNKKLRILASALALVILAGCGVAAGAKTETGKLSSAESITSVDRFLEAIDSNTVINLGAEQLDLSSASSYGTDERGEHWHWEQVYDGYELVIENTENLTITGAGSDKTTIAAEPRYANVLHFVNCRGTNIENLTLGHTPDYAFCSGGVLNFEICNNTVIDGCGMFGCGTVGIIARECTDLSAGSSKIYECSDSAAYLNACRNVSLDNCEIYGNGTRAGQASAMSIFDIRQCESVFITNCSIHGNSVQNFLISAYSKDLLFLSNKVEDNTIYSSVFTLQQYPITVDGCSFSNNGSERFIWYYSQGIYAKDISGKELDKASLEAMEWREIETGEVKSESKPEPGAEIPSGSEITVKTTDEFLTALGPDRTIILDGEIFDLSKASDYGSIGGEYYFWSENYDGPGLIINNVDGLTIKAKSDDPKATTVAAIPRYANVLEFRSCSNITLIGFTAGHTEEPGSCSGGVLSFRNCDGINLEACRLYGCGILGAECSSCTSFKARDCEIYDCSQGGATFWRCDGIEFMNCDFHDIPSPMLSFFESGDKVWNGEPVEGNGVSYDVTKDGKLILMVAYPEQENNGYALATDDSFNLNEP